MAVDLRSIRIRNTLVPGDIGYVTYLHGALYAAEYHYGISFETYVATGLREFYENFEPERDRVWLCEYEGKIVGTLFLMHRAENAAQLRYFLLEPKVRGIGLGKNLMDLYMEFLRACRYRSSYLWTTDELTTAAVLYRRHGFVLTEEKPSTAFGKPLSEQRYELVLAGDR